MPSNRIGRINEEIQRELADQLRRLKDPVSPRWVWYPSPGWTPPATCDTPGSISVFWTRTRRKTC